MQLESVVRFVVRKISDGSFTGDDAITDADPRMIHAPSVDADLTNFKIHRCGGLKLDPAWQIKKFHRKKRRCHLAFQDFLKTTVRSVVAKDADLILVVV